MADWGRIDVINARIAEIFASVTNGRLDGALAQEYMDLSTELFKIAKSAIESWSTENG